MTHAARIVKMEGLGVEWRETLCHRRFRLMRNSIPPVPFTATDPEPRPGWNGQRFNKYCPGCIRVIERESKE